MNYNRKTCTETVTIHANNAKCVKMGKFSISSVVFVIKHIFIWKQNIIKAGINKAILLLHK